MCFIINLHRKKGRAAITPRRLLGGHRDQLRPEDYSTVEEFREAVRKRRAERDGEEWSDGD